MSAGVGWFENYLKGRSRLYEQLERRKERLGGGGGDFEIGKDDMEALLDDIAELKLVVASLLNLLVTKGVLTEQALLEYARTIDRLDGREDGKLHGRVEPDGTITPEGPPERTDLDDLADAVEGR